MALALEKEMSMEREVPLVQQLEKEINTDLIIREKLAIQRTLLANQSTFLAFLRTAMYFMIAGLSVKNLLKVNDDSFLDLYFFLSSGLLLMVGVLNYLHQKHKMEKCERYIGKLTVDHLQEL